MALVTIAAEFGQADGTPVTGTVLIRPYVDAVRMDVNPELVTRATSRGELDTFGVWADQVIASDDPAWMTEEPVPYLVTWAVGGSYAQRVVIIPAPGPWSLWQLVDIADPTITPVPVPGPSAVSADPGNAAILGSDGLVYVAPKITVSATAPGSPLPNEIWVDVT